MVGIKFFHPSDTVNLTGYRYGSKKSELNIHMSEGDIRRLMKFGQKNQLKMGRSGAALTFHGKVTVLSKTISKKKRAPTKPKPAPPLPFQFSVPWDKSKPKTKKKHKSTGKLSEYNLFVKKHRLAGKDMKQIGVLWRKKKQ